MKIDLKDFQEEAVRTLFKHVRNARNEAREGDAQAIILSSPTGSGKTATLTALMERIIRGDETHRPDPDATFLWLSDSPELNTQSREKLLAQSSAFREHELVMLEAPYSQEFFAPGKVHFLNTHKLAKDSLLTRTGDGREFSIWQTIENTCRAKPEHFYAVIDEAHRGMNLTARQMRQAQTIIQKFIFGDATVGLSPVKLVLGMSATPERFARVIEGSTRTKREYHVPPSDVRLSGLLKERIVLFCPEEEQPSDWTLLSEAAKRWKRYCREWRTYCKAQSLPAVDPVFVVQVMDGTQDRTTRTNLDRTVDVLEREIGQFGLGALAHCFEIDGPVQAGGHQIRKTDPSKIERDSVVRVVFFKMALSTGWDCPRAEVMMSFRKARDHTSIAQLVGRMVRTPLARRVEGSEVLNSVSLYLPHYDTEGLRAIVDRLNDPENAPPTEVVEGTRLVSLTRDPAHDAVCSVLVGLPSYCVERIPKTSNTRRLVKLARQLTFDEIDARAWIEAKALVIETLKGELARLREDSRFARFCRENQVIELREVHVEAGDWKETDDSTTTRVKATPENIDDLFDIAGRMLGEGLHRDFWKDQWDREHPQRAKLELFGVLQDRVAWMALETAAASRIELLFNEYRNAIAALPTSHREEYNRIRRRAKEPETVDLLFPEAIEVPREEPLWDKHVYIGGDGRFGWAANSWETAVLKAEMERPDFLAWLRNFPRKPWSLCVPYQRGGEDRPLFPDLITFRSVRGQPVADLLDPHDSGLADAVDKAVGLARYAEKHGDSFGRIELIVVRPNDEISRLDLNRESIRDKVKRVENRAHLEALFAGEA